MSETDSDLEDYEEIQGNGLCDTCKYLRIGQLFTHHGDREISHDTLDEILARQSTCSLCRLIGHTIHQSACALRHLPPPHPDTLPSFDPQGMFPSKNSRFVYLRGNATRWIIKSEDAEGTNATDLAYSIRKGQFNVSSAAPVLRIVVELAVLEALTGEIRLLALDAERLKLPPAFHARKVAKYVDIGLLKDFLSRCSGHFKCQRAKQPSTRRFSNSIWVIDIVQHCVAEMDANCGYVSLSYTWGGDQEYKLLMNNLSAWSQPGGLPALEVLPQTIRDTITICKLLDERYLWIDSLCIVQDDPGTLRGQLEQMDVIYRSARFTIVAADGIGANTGLTGVSRPRQESSQLVGCVKGLQLITPLPPLSEAVNHSFWKTRGWTYQEQLLSPRALVFTQWQVYFQCPTEIYSEDRLPDLMSSQGDEDLVQVDLDEGRDRLEQLFPPKQLSAFHALTEVDQDTPFNSFALYQTAVATYTARNLGNPTDILNAFIGVANVLQEYAGFRGFVGGLSIMGLCDALLWRPVPATGNQIERRLCTNPVTGRPFPSWTWAGWIGAVKVERESDVLQREEVVSKWQALFSGSLKEETTAITLPSVEINDFKDPDLSMSPISWTLLHAHTLRILTSVSCEFLLVAKSSDSTDCSCQWDATKNAEPYRVCLHRPPGVCVGKVELDTSMTPSENDERYILIGISRGWHPKLQQSRGFSMREGGGVAIYNVLVGKRVKGRTDIERRGLGIVLASEWDSTNTKKECITLV